MAGNLHLKANEREEERKGRRGGGRGGRGRGEGRRGDEEGGPGRGQGGAQKKESCSLDLGKLEAEGLKVEGRGAKG